MRYRQYSPEERNEAIEAVDSGLRVSEVSRILEIPDATIRSWLARGEFNQGLGCARIRPKGKCPRRQVPKDPFPEGVEMARDRDPQELERELRDLRRKNAYLEDKVAYLTALYEIVHERPEAIAKKNDSGRSPGSSGTGMAT